MSAKTKHQIKQIVGTIGFAFLYALSNFTGSAKSAKYTIEMYEKWSSEQIESSQPPVFCDNKPCPQIISS
jgi:hypothetical protein